jgi:hypothetical protein
VIKHPNWRQKNWLLRAIRLYAHGIVFFIKKNLIFGIVGILCARRSICFSTLNVMRVFFKTTSWSLWRYVTGYYQSCISWAKPEMENMKSTAGASRDAEEADAICNKNICLPRNTKERANLYCYIFFFSEIRRRAAYHYIKIGEKEGPRG